MLENKVDKNSIETSSTQPPQFNVVSISLSSTFYSRYNQLLIILLPRLFLYFIDNSCYIFHKILDWIYYAISFERLYAIFCYLKKIRKRKKYNWKKWYGETWRWHQTSMMVRDITGILGYHKTTIFTTITLKQTSICIFQMSKIFILVAKWLTAVQW